jgi:LuxR family transcriptional regulator
MAHYQAENYFAIDPVLRPENFLRGHLPWNDKLFHDAPELWDGARPWITQRGDAVPDVAEPCSGILVRFRNKP